MAVSLKRIVSSVAVSFALAGITACAPVNHSRGLETAAMTSQQQALSSPVQFERNKDGIWGVMDVKGMRMGSGFEIGPQGERVANYNVFISNPGKDGSDPYFYQCVDGQEQFLIVNGDQVQELDTENPQTPTQARLLDNVRALADHFSENMYKLTGAKEPYYPQATKSRPYDNKLVP